MSNMTYCMFQNTLGDLRDCEVRLSEVNSLDDLSKEEAEAARALIRLCRDIGNDFDWWAEE